MPKAGQDSRFKFSCENRLKRQSAFQAIFASPCKIKRRYLIALCRLNAHHISRLGIVISKQAIKGAVARNRTRRVVRESFRHHQSMLKGLDIVIVIRSECTALLQDDIDSLWAQLATFLPSA